MLKYVQVGGTVVCLGLSAATATVGNTEIAGLFAAIPVSYWIIYAALRAKRISDERRKARMNEIEATYAKLAKEREERRAQEGLQTRNEAQQRYTAQQRLYEAQQQQRQAFNNMQAQRLAAQQSMQAQQRYGMGYSDPRAVQGMGFVDTMLATAIGNAVGDAISAGVGVTRTRTEETGEVKIEHVPVREVYRSSDTSSDSFSSSDTGSDSF